MSDTAKSEQMAKEWEVESRRQDIPPVDREYASHMAQTWRNHAATLRNADTSVSSEGEANG